MKHPESTCISASTLVQRLTDVLLHIVRDVCDIGQALFGGSKWAYNATAVFFLLNNTFIQGKLREALHTSHLYR